MIPLRHLTAVVILVFTLPGCASLVVTDEDSAGAATGKVAARAALGIVTLGLSESPIGKYKKEREAIAWPITAASRKPPSPDAPKTGRFIIWSNHPQMTGRITQSLQELGNTVLERAHLQQILDEQSIRLTHTSDDDAQLLRVGKLLGATRIIFAEATVRTENQNRMVIAMGMGGSVSGSVYYVSVGMRCVNVDTGEITWSASATFDKPANPPDAGVDYLTTTALRRVMCPMGQGYRWVDPGPYREGGCISLSDR